MQNFDFSELGTFALGSIAQYSEVISGHDKIGVWTNVSAAQLNSGGGGMIKIPIECRLLNYDIDKPSHFGSYAYTKGIGITMKYVLAVIE